MKKNLLIMLLIFSFCLVPMGYCQTEPDLGVLTAEVIEVHPGKGAPDTMTVKIKGKYAWEKDSEQGITIDPDYCKFYKDDAQPKTIDIVKPGDKIEITYDVVEGITVAFNVVVLPEPDAAIE